MTPDTASPPPPESGPRISPARSGAGGSPLAAALEIFQEGYNCAQAVVHACAAEQGLDGDQALRLATGFGGGMGRMQEVCGALTGAVIVLGLRHGRVRGASPEWSELTYRRVQALLQGFATAHGSCRCRELLAGCDLCTEAGQREYHQRGYRARCETFIRDTIAMLDADARLPPEGPERPPP